MYEVSTDLIGQPDVQRANILWSIWKCEDLKSLGIGGDNAQRSVNHDQSGAVRYCMHLFFTPFSETGAPHLPAASDEWLWPVEVGGDLKSYCLDIQAKSTRLLFPASSPRKSIYFLISQSGKQPSRGVGKVISVALPQRAQEKRLNCRTEPSSVKPDRAKGRGAFGLAQMGYDG